MVAVMALFASTLEFEDIVLVAPDVSVFKSIFIALA
jgi:hypothetical protein